ncbi:MAG: hypothetical protein WC694_02470 [Candidatus Paceibacterota bacterium]|jgi:hypothetical protein
MENKPYESKRYGVAELMRGDYPNEYISFFMFLNHISEKPGKPKSFSDKYPNNTVFGVPFKEKVTTEDELKIKKLDKISIEAGRLIDEDPMDINSLLEIAAQAMEICDRVDLSLILRERIKA